MKKGDRLTNIIIETMAAEGKCIARIDGKVAFIDGGAPGDVVDIELTKIKSNFLEARVVAVQKFSEYRDQPFCEHFGLCGGCVWQHIQYAE
ncbi:MAG: TRAM domain-containing protein [Bacteroidota bacterium]